MPDFQDIIPVLKVRDLSQALEFYTSLLGFQIAWRGENDGGGENAMLTAGTISLLLSTGAHLGGDPQFTGTLYFNLRGIDELWDRIHDRVKVIWPLESMEYGQREFGIQDLDGYTLAFAESLEVAS